MLRKLVPEIVNTSVLIATGLEATAREAAVAMATHRVAAVLVMDGKRLKGILTERDITVRVVAEGRNPDTTPVTAVMTPDPHTLAPDATATAALALMHAHGFRHLPIVEDDRVVAMVSMRDLYGALAEQEKAEAGDGGGPGTDDRAVPAPA